MAFCLRYQAELEERLGRSVLVQLFELVRKGVIDKQNLQRISYSYNMDVLTTFDSRKEEERIEVTMERMLDRWYEDTVCNMSPTEALQELLRILEETCPPLVRVRIRGSNLRTGSEVQSTGDSGSVKGEGETTAETDEEVLEMLENLGLVEHEEVFRRQQLSLTDIAQLDHEALKSIGISLVKHRAAIIRYTSTSGKHEN